MAQITVVLTMTNRTAVSRWLVLFFRKIVMVFVCKLESERASIIKTGWGSDYHPQPRYGCIGNAEQRNHCSKKINQQGKKERVKPQKLNHRIFTIWCQSMWPKEAVWNNNKVMSYINIAFFFSEKFLIHCDHLWPFLSYNPNSSSKVQCHDYSGNSLWHIKLLY